MHALVVDDEPASVSRFTVVASRRVGNAVRRNRAKRLLREAVRAQEWRSGIDVVLVARTPCAESDVEPVQREVERLGSSLGAFLADGRP